MRIRKVLIYCFCAAAVGLAAVLLSKNAGGFSDWYAEHIFPIFTNSVGRILSPIPFSVFEMGIYAVLVGTVFCILYSVILTIVPKKRKKAKKAAINGICVLLIVASTSFMMISLTCTVNYGRKTYAELANQSVAPSSKDELIALCNLLIDDVAELAGQIPVDERGFFTMAGMDIKKEAIASMKSLGEENAILSGYYPNPKPVMLSKVMSAINLTGIYSPITVEANYNRDVVDYVMPYTICHELAHLKGFIREDEAGFIAYMACMKSETPEFRYSGTLNALEYALRACYREVSGEEYAEVAAAIPDQARRDIIANYEYWRQFAGKASELSEKANDTYLKANAQEGGVKSYGRMVDLLIAQYRIGAEEV